MFSPHGQILLTELWYATTCNQSSERHKPWLYLKQLVLLTETPNSSHPSRPVQTSGSFLYWPKSMKTSPQLFTLLVGCAASALATLIGDLPSHAFTAQQQFDLCRSVMENRPYNPATDGPNPKPMNSIGYGAYPPPDQRGIWIDNECSEIPGIYVPF